MGDLTKNLSRHEFECKCGCGYNVVDWDLPDVIQDVVNHFQDIHIDKVLHVKINSGTRCAKHNAFVGGKPESDLIPFSGSMHLYGMAADFVIYYKKQTRTGMVDEVIHADDVADYLEKRYPNRMGIGRYIGRTHVDTRTNKARWDQR